MTFNMKLMTWKKSKNKTDLVWRKAVISPDLDGGILAPMKKGLEIAFVLKGKIELLTFCVCKTSLGASLLKSQSCCLAFSFCLCLSWECKGRNEEWQWSHRHLIGTFTVQIRHFQPNGLDSLGQCQRIMFIHGWIFCSKFDVT